MTADVLRKLLEHGVDPKDLQIAGDPPNPFEKPFVKRETIMAEEKKDDPVNHPSHYTSSPAVCTCGRPIECIDVVRHQNFNRGNAIKYVWRAGSKDDEVQDLKKAVWYLNDEIRKIEAERLKARTNNTLTKEEVKSSSYSEESPADGYSRTVRDH